MSVEIQASTAKLGNTQMLTANVTPLLVMADNNRITTEEGRISFQLHLKKSEVLLIKFQ